MAVLNDTYVNGTLNLLGSGIFSSGLTVSGAGSKAPLILKNGVSDYREGLRILMSSDSWSDIILGGSDTNEASGTSSNAWFIGNNNGNLYITRNGSSDAGLAQLKCVNNAWSISGGLNIGSYSINSAGYFNGTVDWTNVNNRPPYGGSQTFTSGHSSSGEHNCNSITYNGHFYYTSNGPSGLGEESTDGALYCQAYDSNWLSQIAQDYRSGRLFVRSKKSGSWQSWKRIPYSSELGSVASYNASGVVLSTNLNWDAPSIGFGDSFLTGHSFVGSIASSDTSFESNGGWVNIINCRHRGGGVSDGTLYGLQIISALCHNDYPLYFRKQNNGSWGSWYRICNLDTSSNLSVPGSIYAGSDRKLKCHFKKPDINFINTLQSLKLREFNFKSQNDPENKFIGLIAQELESALPKQYRNNIVKLNTPDNFLTINEGKFPYLLLGGIQELIKKDTKQDKEILKLKEENKLLKSKNKSLEVRMNKLEKQLEKLLEAKKKK